MRASLATVSSTFYLATIHGVISGCDGCERRRDPAQFRQRRELAAYLMESMWSVRRHGIGNKQSGKGTHLCSIVSHGFQMFKDLEHSLTVQDCCKIHEVDPPSKLKLYTAKATHVP
ncbi:hypothetical protein B0H14DRAFT_2579186 [Mycena olivaceomarginata]|nr:hypothetical protein B0H14DRAFT_2579186 [Mycena olivaceomarginata]